MPPETPQYRLSADRPVTGRNNVWYADDGSETVFIFVHGLASDSGGCWLNDASPECFWPDLILADRRITCKSIYLGGFHTGADATNYGIADCATELFDALRRVGADGRTPPFARRRLVFVCHSSGGIVVRYLLTENADAFRGKQVGLLLYASPSYGSRLANLFSPFARLLKNELALALRWGNSELRDLDRRFDHLIQNRRIEHLVGREACEHHPVLSWGFLARMPLVVPALSAGRYFRPVRRLPGTNHFTCVKPDSLTHPAHEYLVDFWTNVFSTPAESTEKPAQAAWHVQHEITPAIDTATVPIAKLPPAPVRFLGRDEELRDLCAVILGDGQVAILIHGGPGMGKSSLSLKAAHDPSVIARFGIRRWFAAL